MGGFENQLQSEPLMDLYQCSDSSLPPKPFRSVVDECGAEPDCGSISLAISQRLEGVNEAHILQPLPHCATLSGRIGGRKELVGAAVACMEVLSLEMPGIASTHLKLKQIIATLHTDL